MNAGKFIAERRRPASRCLMLAAGRRSEYDPCSERRGYRVMIGVVLWWWAIGWRGAWRVET